MQRWFPWRVPSRRGYRPAVQYFVPNLLTLEERFSASALGVMAQLDPMARVGMTPAPTTLIDERLRPTGRDDAAADTSLASLLSSEDVILVPVSPKPSDDARSVTANVPAQEE
jgi:hypothetical protein